MQPMSDASKDAPRPVPSLVAPRPIPPDDEKMVCERCGGTSVYRMHAVWRCADCGFKTDCCGW
jgi:hypothetical protein